jgi:tyrosine-protein phosphatase SIW14
MGLNQKSFRNALGALAAVLVLASVSFAQNAADNAALSKINIKNFGQMDERFYRGAQPKEEDYKVLAAMGIKTVIDLQDDPKAYEKPMVESLGMKYVNIPMVSKKYPTDEAVQTFLKTVNDPATGKFFVHCAGGRHRTGSMGAVYRYQFYHWNFEQVYAEMKKYDFYTSWGHGAFKEFVQDYYQHMQANQTQAKAAVAAPVEASKTPVTVTKPVVATKPDSIQVSDSISAQDKQ